MIRINIWQITAICELLAPGEEAENRYTKVLDQDQLRPTKDQLGDQLKTN